MQVRHDKADELARRVLRLRNFGVSRQRIGEEAGLGTGAKLVRVERGDVHDAEVAPLLAALVKLEAEVGAPFRLEMLDLPSPLDVEAWTALRADQRTERWSSAEDLQVAARTGTRCWVCAIWWSGAQTAHCSVCHFTFTVPSVFDAHRIGPAEYRECRLPSDVLDHQLPLRQIERGGALAWTYPVTPEAAVRLRALNA